MSKPRLSPSRSQKNEAALTQALTEAIQKAITQAVFGPAGAGQADFPALVVARARTPMAPMRLAASQPGDVKARAQASAVYHRCLEAYRKGVRPQDNELGVDDAGAAVAFFVAANLEALHGVKASPEVLLGVERQLIRIVRASWRWEDISVAERQFLFEQMAVLGVFVAGLWERAPTQGQAAIANVRAIARRYLQQFLGLNPDMLALDENGLSVRAAPAVQHAA